MTASAARPLTAAATQITRSIANQQYVLRLAAPWQIRALYYATAIPELKYASNFYARMLQKIRIYPAILQDDGNLKPIEEGLPLELLNRIQDPSGGRTQILTMYGQLKFITGECYLFGRNIGGNEKWSVVWREELRFDEAGKVTHVIAPQIPMDVFRLSDNHYEELPTGSAVAYKMWTSSPRFSGWPTSPMEGVMEMAEELLVLSQSVHATATSRLVKSKLLFLPSEMEPAPLDTNGDEDPASSPYLQDLTQHIENAIDNPGIAGSLAPFITFMDGDLIALIRDISLHDPTTDYLEKDLRKECIERISYGLDLPPEVIEGMSGSNHWGSWMITEDMWRSHGAPIAEQFCDDIGEAYLRPALRDAGYDDWREVVVAFDASAVVVNPDRSKDADAAMDRGELSGFGYRKMKNIPDEWAPSDEERRMYLAMKVKNSTGGEIASDTGEKPPGEPGDVSEGNNMPASAFQGAAELALHRCRELAGSRIRSRRKSCPGCLDEVQHIENGLVASALGVEGLIPLGAPDPLELVAGGADSFKSLLMGWGNNESSAAAVAKMLEMHAARTLFHDKPPKIPASLEIV